jgi:nucleotide-binding universal stress UspA family protein
MIALKNVLVPTDFSETSAIALRYGKALAGAFDASLHVLHVVQEPFAQPWAVEAYGFSLATLQEEWMREAKARMATTLSDAERAKYRAELATVLGHPVVEILKYAADHLADLIVLGTHGRRGVRRIVLGSDAEQVVRQSPVPVLLVRA